MFYVLFFLLQLLLPVCFVLGALIDRTFVLVSEPVILLLLTTFTVFLTGKLYRGKDSRWAMAAPLFSLVNGIFVLFFIDWWGSLLAAVAAVVCGWVIFFKAPDRITRTLYQILYVLLTICFALLLPIFLFATAMGQTTVVRELDSPGGRYCAQLIDVDAGATGGDTLVKLRDNDKTLPIGIGSFLREYTVYSGEWGEFQDMELSWQDEDTLLINGSPYEVDTVALSGSRNALDALGISVSHARILQYSDTHGGFHGDGTTLLVLSGDACIPDSRFWHDLPMTKNVRDALESFGPEGMPEIKNGQWFFLDRHSKTTDPTDSSMLFGRGSWNFTLAVYDSDAEVLYYLKVDT